MDGEVVAGAVTPNLPAQRSRSQLGELVSLAKRNRDYRRLFLASVVSYLGDWFALVAVSGLVRDLTGYEGATALVFAAEVLPVFLLAPVAGVLADRFDRKRIMIASALGRFVPAVGLLGAVAWEQAWLAYACVAAISAGAAFYEPLAPAVVPNLVDDEDLSIATTSIATIWGTMLFLGAAIGGAVTAVAGREVAFVINAATFLVAAAMLARVKAAFSEGEVTAAASVLANLAEVRALLRDRPVVAKLLTTKAGVGMGNGIVGLLPLLALDVYHAGDAGTGVLLAARGAGVVVGPFLGRSVAQRGDGRLLLRLIPVAITSYGLAYLTLPFAPSLQVAALVVFVAHLGGGYQWVASTEALQRTTPDAIRGRIMTLDFSLVTLAIGTSSILAAVMAGVFGLTTTIRLLAVVPIAYAGSWLYRTRTLWSGPVDPLVMPGLRAADRPGLVVEGDAGA